MPPIKEQLVGVIDCLPETEQSLLLEVARRFLPDDMATPDGLDAIQTARARRFPMKQSIGICKKGPGVIPRLFLFLRGL